MIQLIIMYQGTIFEDVGINRISAFLDERGVNNNIIYVQQDATLSEMLKNIPHDKYYGFSVYGSNVEQIAELGIQVKKANPEAIIIWGSQYVTLAYAELFCKYSNAVDIMVLGDGEFPLIDILRKSNYSVFDITKPNPHLVSKNDTANKCPCFTDIKALPWPKHDNKIMKKHLYTTIKTSNGCAGDCAFCGYVRRKWSGYSGRQIYDEIVSITKKYNIRAFMIADSSIEDPGNYGKQRLHELLDCIEESNEHFSFFANIRAESFQDNESDMTLLKRMKTGGFRQLFVGIESGNNEDLNIYSKKASLEDNHQILSLLSQIGIESKWGFIMLNPYSTKEKLIANYEFLVENHSYDPFHFMSFLMIYINSALYNRAAADGLLLSSFDKMEANYKFVDPFAKTIYDFFLNRYNDTELQFNVKQFKDNLLLYYHLSQITGVDYDNSVETIKQKIAELNERFFSLIYIDSDLRSAEKEFHNYSNQMVSACREMVSLKNLIMRSYISFNKII
jgi:radical SAM superfamily enzyme YgiQ (UPF0313 family)